MVSTGVRVDPGLLELGDSKSTSCPIVLMLQRRWRPHAIWLRALSTWSNYTASLCHMGAAWTLWVTVKCCQGTARCPHWAEAFHTWADCCPDQATRWLVSMDTGTLHKLLAVNQDPKYWFSFYIQLLEIPLKIDIWKKLFINVTMQHIMVVQMFKIFWRRWWQSPKKLPGGTGP